MPKVAPNESSDSSEKQDKIQPLGGMSPASRMSFSAGKMLRKASIQDSTGLTLSLSAEPAAVRRSSLGLSTSMIYPQSPAERHESVKVTRAMEEKYGFNFLTNEFSINPNLEKEYQAYCTEINLNPACNSSILIWLLWIITTLIEVPKLISGNADERLTALISLLFALPVLVATPFLVMICRNKKYQHRMQVIFCILVHCCAFSLLGSGLICASQNTLQIVQRDIGGIESLATNMSAISSTFCGYVVAQYPNTYTANITGQVNVNSQNGLLVFDNVVLNTSQIFTLNNNTSFWSYPDRIGSLQNTLWYYVAGVILPIAQLNANLVRPIIILLIAPLFKLDTYYFIATAITTNLCYFIFLSLTFPVTSDQYLIRNKFYLVFVLAGLSAIMALRVRQTDRFMRLNFLHIRSAEEKVRIAQEQKEQIQNENRSLKRMLEAQTAHGKDALDLDSPMAKVITDLTKIQQSPNLDAGLQQHLNEIVTLLTKQGHNLFAPDIHEQLKMKREVDLDADTKGWATTVLASKSYQRNNNRRSSTQSDEESIQPVMMLRPEVRLPDEATLSKVNDMMKNDGWNIDIHAVAELSNGKPISYVTYVIFERHNMFSFCSVEKHTMVNFFWFIDAGYLPNPYHNNCHAADVVNYVEFMISTVDNGFFLTLLNIQEVFAAIVAAAIHDFRHPGKSNNFLVKSQHTLAVKYSDSSVLERMHLAESFFLASERDFNIFSGMKPKQYTEVRKAIIEMVLTTDLSVHLQLVGSLKAALLSQNRNDVMDSPMMLMKIIIKCADVGHSSKCTQLHARWSELIIEEFFLQGDEEKALGMEISPFMNRAFENSAKNQLGFFEFIILPFFDVVAEIVFTPGFKPILDQVHINYNLWKKAEAMQLKSIKDILDQVFNVDEHATSSMNRISFLPKQSSPSSPTASSVS
ncbi:calcium/calmodulin-dependent 3',5'-cyclic nucleotide phosphodiesterase [Thraustotheca clavata]|uniref:Phosphodiesterase n=1 Tax=Thraustotheca clavata TaxID=74557 RepID=A0A1V9YU83_9STRA|nr:calcium/calmodulin-dependent 3',5'-cyclic nucleotide phosphodiesterase [Thraustotheca clavata]